MENLEIRPEQDPEILEATKEFLDLANKLQKAEANDMLRDLAVEMGLFKEGQTVKEGQDLVMLISRGLESEIQFGTDKKNVLEKIRSYKQRLENELVDRR